MQQKQAFLLLGPFISHLFTYWTVRIQTRPGIFSKKVSEYNKVKTTITNCKQTHGTARKSHTTIARNQEDKLRTDSSLMPPFHQGLFCTIDPIRTRLSPINQFFNPPDCRPESPPIVSPFLTRLSPDYINARQIEAVITFWPASDEHVPIISAGLVFAL